MLRMLRPGSKKNSPLDDKIALVTNLVDQLSPDINAIGQLGKKPDSEICREFRQLEPAWGWQTPWGWQTKRVRYLPSIDCENLARFVKKWAGGNISPQDVGQLARRCEDIARLCNEECLREILEILKREKRDGLKKAAVCMAEAFRLDNRDPNTLDVARVVIKAIGRELTKEEVDVVTLIERVIESGRETEDGSLGKWQTS